MEKNNNQELILWDEEMQTNVNKGFCSPDDVLNLSGDQIINAGSGGEDNSSLCVSNMNDQPDMEELSGGNTCLMQCEQTLSAPLEDITGADQLMRTPLSSRSRVEYETQLEDPSGCKPVSPLEQQGSVEHKEAIGSEEGPIIAKLGPVATRSTLTENLRTSAANVGDHSNNHLSSFSTCLPENILDGINLNVSEVGAKALMAPYIQEEQDIHTINTVQSTTVDRILYGFDLSCERDGDQYSSLDQMTYEYDVACGEDEVQYTSLDPVSYSFDVSCEPEEDLNTSVDPMSYEFEVACARDDDEMVCFSQSTLDGGKVGDVTPSDSTGKAINNAHYVLQSWSDTELVIGSLEHQSNMERSSGVIPLRSEDSCKRTAVTEISVNASQDQMLSVKEVYQTEQALTSLGKDCTPEMKPYPDYCEPATLCYQYLSPSQDKEPSQLGMDECFSKQRDGGSVEPTNTSVTNYTLSLCQAASWDCSTAPDTDCVEKPSHFTGKISEESSRVTSAVPSNEISSSLDGSAVLGLPALGSVERPGLTGQVAQVTEKETEAIQPEVPLFVAIAPLPDDKEISQDRLPSQNGEALTEPVLIQTGPNVSPTRNEEVVGEVAMSSPADASSLVSVQPSTSGELSVPTSTSTSTATICRPAVTFTAKNVKAAEGGAGASPDRDSEATSEQLCLPKNEARPVSEENMESGEFFKPVSSAKPAASVTSREQQRDIIQLDDFSEMSKVAREKTPSLLRERSENEETAAEGLEVSSSKELPIECKAITRETPTLLSDVAGMESEDTFKPRADLSDEHIKVSKYPNINRDYQVDCVKPLWTPTPGQTLPSACDTEKESCVAPVDVAASNPMPLGEPSLYTCTKCSVYFQDKEYLHRHMLDHFDGQSEEGFAGGARPFTCHECGHAFCDPASLRKHMSLHQARRASFMEAIQELKDPWSEGHPARLQCPQCTFGTNSTKLFVEHAKVHVNKTSHPCQLCKFLAATAKELQEHKLRFHPVKKSKALRAPGPRMLPQSAKMNLHVNKESLSTKQVESMYKDHMKFSQQHLYQQKPGCPPERLARPSTSQGAADLRSQSDKCENSQMFLPSSSLDHKPERMSLPLTAKGPSRYQGDHPLMFQGGLMNKTALDVTERKNAKLKMHSLVGITKQARLPNAQYKPSMGLSEYSDLREGKGTVLFPLAKESYSPQKGAIYPTSGPQKKKMEVDGEGGANQGNALTYRKIIIDHFSSRTTNSGPPVHKGIVRVKTYEEGAAGNKTCNVLFKGQLENLKHKASGSTGFRIQISDIKSLHAKKGRRLTEPTAASCRPRTVKKRTKDMLATINIPQDLPVDQHQQLVRMTPLILLEKMESQSECEPIPDEKELNSFTEPKETHSQHEPKETHSQREPKEGRSPGEPKEGRSPGEPKEGRSPGEPKEGRSPGEPKEGRSPGEPKEGRSPGEPKEGRSPGEPKEGRSPGEPKEGRSPGEPKEGRSQGEPKEGRSPGEPKEGRSPGEPKEGRSPGEPKEGRSPGEPKEGRSPGEPKEGRSPGEPKEGRSPGEPKEGRSPGEPKEGRSPGEPKEGRSPGEPKEGRSPGEPKEGRSPGEPKEGRSEGEPKEGRSPGEPKEGRSPGEPKEGRSPGEPKEGRSPGEPKEGRSPGEPKEGRSPGEPKEGRSPGEPKEGRSPGEPKEGRSPGEPKEGRSPGEPKEGRSPGEPKEGRSPGEPKEGRSPGEPKEGRSPGEPKEGRSPGEPKEGRSPGEPKEGRSPGEPKEGRSPGEPKEGRSPGEPKEGRSPGEPKEGRSPGEPKEGRSPGEPKEGRSPGEPKEGRSPGEPKEGRSPGEPKEGRSPGEPKEGRSPGEPKEGRSPGEPKEGRSPGEPKEGRSPGEPKEGRSPGEPKEGRSPGEPKEGRSPGEPKEGRSPGEPKEGRSPGEPKEGRSPGEPKEGRSPGEPKEGRSPGEPKEGRSPGEPKEGRSPGEPKEGRSPGEPKEGRSPGEPKEGRSPGEPKEGRSPGEPKEGRSPGEPKEGRSPGGPFAR
ncbi:uncharacterized protein [Heptranchias perlo]|uniref:uncharacterized protein n=1 Tax=Heptranchias perlo TaxID=212740 RepID=UPI003559CE77